VIDPKPKKSRKGIGGRPKGRHLTVKLHILLEPSDRDLLRELCRLHGKDASKLIRSWIYAAAALREEKSD
jgi:hypothetical protein